MDGFKFITKDYFLIDSYKILAASLCTEISIRSLSCGGFLFVPIEITVFYKKFKKIKDSTSNNYLRFLLMTNFIVNRGLMILPFVLDPSGCSFLSFQLFNYLIWRSF